MQIIFEETQFLPVWSKVMMMGGALLTLYFLKKHNTYPGDIFRMQGVALICTFLLMLLLSILMLTAKLEMSVSDKGIMYRSYPFQQKLRHISWEDIRFCYIRKYRPIMEYGGWGLRTGNFRSGNAINASGCYGLQLVFNNGKRLLIGTRNQEELKQILTENDWYLPENERL